MPTATPSAARGGMWLFEERPAGPVFTPERLSDEHRLMAQTAAEFVEKELLPALPELEQKNWTLARTLVRRAGGLGLLGVNVSEEYGGVDLDKVSSLIVSEQVARVASFAATFGAQANLCILPIYLFGTDAQKKQYLPGLVAGELVGAYALSEAGSGSDALAAKTRATRQADGSWLLSGEKMWITNGGFADVIIVFAKVDGEQFSAFIVERAFPGVSPGKEEHKMGLHGSSTTPILLQDARVPAENLLGEIGKGHKVALNTLNFGRFKLGAMCIGGCKAAIGDAAAYAVERRQFGQPIATFGAIKHKLGEMTARTYALESLMYRTAGLIDEAAGEDHDAQAVARAVEEFAIEASIAKVTGSEVLDYVLDENVQIHGGNGFVSDYPAERYYRDARVNRIFEGTNEINRLLIPGMLVRRALKGELPLIAAAKALQDEIMTPSMPATALGDSRPLDDERKAVAAFKKVVLMVIGTAMQTYGQKLTDEQEILGLAADLLIETYLAESAVLRAQAALDAGTDRASLHADAARLFVAGAAARIDATTREALAGMAEGDTLRTLLAALRRVLKVTPVNAVALRRRLAEETTARRRYIFECGGVSARNDRNRVRTASFMVVGSGFSRIVVLLALVASACSSGPTPLDDTASYTTKVQAHRAQKDAFFQSSSRDNPVPRDKQAELLPLPYYPIDPDYRIPAALKPSAEQPTFDMPTSTGAMRKMTQVGTLGFTVKGQPMALTAFAGEGPGGAPDMSRLFVPFSDATSGVETYEAGRFLDLDRTATGVYVIDFNDAYNPYCAYNATFECPLPPPSNRLTVPIRAGEKIRPKASAPSE